MSTPSSHSLRLSRNFRKCFLPRIEMLEDRSVPSMTYTVSNLNDSGGGSLRDALSQANANEFGTPSSPDLINFTIAGTISPTSALPALASGEVAVIDATTAPGYSGTPVVILDGTQAGAGVDGLVLSGGSSTIKGFDIVNFSRNGIVINSNGGDAIVSSMIGLTTAGTAAHNGANGIWINNTSGNTIGSAAAGLGNVISGNSADGIRIDGLQASNNVVLGNKIGTNAAGGAAVGNTGNGIHITNGGNFNTIGGNAANATAFTGKPVDGNVISGNGANGVLIDAVSVRNTLSGNYIGTDLSGTHALGNTLDGVAILNSDFNQLIGTTFTQSPFVYLNDVSGNGGNGLRIHNSNNTVVHANAFGLGGDNSTAIPNHLDGVLIEGSSANTEFGGVIPLGNIVASNSANGVEIKDTASGTVCFNTFCGLPAFQVTTRGNALDGFLISSTGGNNLLRTNVISGNVGNGVHITGNATGVQVGEDIIGMNTSAQSALPNGGDGILIDGNAHANVIGGLQVSVITQNTISANGGDGIAIVGNSYSNQVFHSFIGTNIFGLVAFGNGGAGIRIGGNSQGNTIGGTGLFDQNIISANLGDGIVLTGNSTGTQVLNNLIGADRTGLVALANQGNGISITGSNNQIGGSANGDGNVIGFNTLNGIAVSSGTGNSILGNSIFSNSQLGINLTAGGNRSQTAPVLTEAVQPGAGMVEIFGSCVSFDGLFVSAVQPGAGMVEIFGTLTAAANTAYRIEFFASPSLSTPGQGRTFIGFVNGTTDATGTVRFRFQGTQPTGAGLFLTATATDPTNDTSAFSSPIFLSGGSQSILTVGPGAGGGSSVTVLNQNGSTKLSFDPFPGFTGGIRTATADVNGDGTPDYIVGSGPGITGSVKVYDGQTLALLAQFQPYETSFTGGVFVAAGYISADGYADIVVAPDSGGGPVVAVYDGKSLASGNVVQTARFLGIQDPNFRGGARAAVGDLNGDGYADIVVSAGAGGGPRVSEWDGKATLNGTASRPLTDFFAFEPALRNGTSVAVGDVNGDGFADLIFGAGLGGSPRVRIVNGVGVLAAGNFGTLDNASVANLTIGDFFSGDPNSRGGIEVAALNLGGDAFPDVVTGGGSGQPSIVQVYLAGTVLGTGSPPVLFSDNIFNTNNGIYVG